MCVYFIYLFKNIFLWDFYRFLKPHCIREMSYSRSPWSHQAMVRERWASGVWGISGGKSSFWAIRKGCSSDIFGQLILDCNGFSRPSGRAKHHDIRRPVIWRMQHLSTQVCSPRGSIHELGSQSSGVFRNRGERDYCSSLPCRYHVNWTNWTGSTQWHCDRSFSSLPWLQKSKKLRAASGCDEKGRGSKRSG